MRENQDPWMYEEHSHFCEECQDFWNHDFSPECCLVADMTCPTCVQAPTSNELREEARDAKTNHNH